MLNPIYTRKSPVFKSPFASIEEVGAFADHLAAVLKDASGRDPDVSVSLTYPDRSFPTMSRDEFHEAEKELAFHDLMSIEVTAKDCDDSDFSVGVLVTADLGGRVGVRGRSVTRVDGVDIQVRKELDRLRETRDHEARKRLGRRVEAAGRLAEGTLPGVPVASIAAEVGRLLTLRGRSSRTGSSAPRPPVSAGWWRRFANNPWTITIVGGAIAAAIAVGLVALAISLATSASSRDPTGSGSASPQAHRANTGP